MGGVNPLNGLLSRALLGPNRRIPATRMETRGHPQRPILPSNPRLNSKQPFRATRRRMPTKPKPSQRRRMAMPSRQLKASNTAGWNWGLVPSKFCNRNPIPNDYGWSNDENLPKWDPLPRSFSIFRFGEKAPANETNRHSNTYA